MKAKITKYSFWVGLSGAAVVVAESIFQLLGTSLFDASYIGELIMAICSLLIVLGIVSKPQKNNPEQEQEQKEEQKQDLNDEI